MDVIDGVMVGPAGVLQQLTCADCGGLVVWRWRERKGRWESRHRCDFQVERIDYVARPVVFAIERADYPEPEQPALMAPRDNDSEEE
jgi:hypothetical protein